jgi:hypothetical protein
MLSPAARAQTGTIDHDGQPLTLAIAPTTQANTNVAIADGSRVNIICQSEGQSLSGDSGATNVWDFIDVDGGLFAPDAFVNTGTNNLVAPICGAANGNNAFGIVEASNGLNERTAPHTSASIITTLANQTVVFIACQTHGDTINGTSLWDELNNGGFVTDAFVFTGTDNQIAGSC